MNLVTKLKKLRKMSADELRCRARDAVQQRRERRAYRSGAPLSDAALNWDDRGLLVRAAEMTPGASAAALGQLEREFPSEYAALRARCLPVAQQALEGSLRLLSRDVALAELPDWQADPLTGFRFAAAFYADVPAESLAGQVDVKYVWELNRCQFLVEMSRGYLLTGDERFAQRCQELLLSWIEQNPLYQGVNWTSALEVSMRAISWQWAVAGLSQWNGWRSESLRRITGSLFNHAEYLQNHLSWYSSPYNHLMGEAAGLYLLSNWLDELPAVEGWRRTALDVFNRRVQQQFYADGSTDGFTVEQGAGYHWYTLGFLLLVLAAELRRGQPLPAWHASVAQALEAGAAFVQPDGRWPAIGDVDSARSLPVQPSDFWDFRGLSALGTELLGLEELKAVSPTAREETFWLRGIEGVRRWHSLPAPPRPLKFVLPSAGYAIAKSSAAADADWLCFDAGPIADGLFTDDTPSVAHGHLDLLQVLYCASGKPVLVDGGMPHYYGEAAWLEFFRGVQGHNTLAVAGAPPALPAGRLGWHSVRNDVRLESCLSDSAWFCRGTLRLAPTLTVQRHLFAMPGSGLWLADVIESDAARRIEWSWNLLPAVDRQSLDAMDQRATLRYDGGTLELCTTAPRMEVRLDFPTDAGPAGWICPEYGARSPACRVVASAVADGEMTLLTSLRHAPCNVNFYRPEQELANADASPLGLTVSRENDILWQFNAPGQAEAFVVAAGTMTNLWSRLSGVGDLAVWHMNILS